MRVDFFIPVARPVAGAVGCCGPAATGRAVVATAAASSLRNARRSSMESLIVL
jgi:hypothetical protein